MRISDWSSDVCSSDLDEDVAQKCVLDVDLAGRRQMENLIEKSHAERGLGRAQISEMGEEDHEPDRNQVPGHHRQKQAFGLASGELRIVPLGNRRHHQPAGNDAEERSEEHTSELQSL